MKVFKTIGDFFKNIFFPKVKSFLSAVFNNAVQIAISEVMDFARTAVAELSLEDLTNSEKRNEAYKRIVARLKDEGKEIKESIIRTTIELALLELKNTVGDKE
jgi:hypothetical protein